MGRIYFIFISFEEVTQQVFKCSGGCSGILNIFVEGW